MKEPVYFANMMPALRREQKLNAELDIRLAKLFSGIEEQAAEFLNSDDVRADFRYHGRTFYRIGEGSIERVDPMDVFADPSKDSAQS